MHQWFSVFVLLSPFWNGKNPCHVKFFYIWKALKRHTIPPLFLLGRASSPSRFGCSEDDILFHLNTPSLCVFWWEWVHGSKQAADFPTTSERSLISRESSVDVGVVVDGAVSSLHTIWILFLCNRVPVLRRQLVFRAAVEASESSLMPYDRPLQYRVFPFWSKAVTFEFCSDVWFFLFRLQSNCERF